MDTSSHKAWARCPGFSDNNLASASVSSRPQYGKNILNQEQLPRIIQAKRGCWAVFGFLDVYDDEDWRCRPVASKLAVGHRSACMPCIHNSGYIRSRLRQSGAIVLQYKNTNNSTKRDPIHKYHKATEFSHTGCTYIGWPMNDLFCSQVMLFTEWQKTGNCKYFAQKFLLEMNMEETILLPAVSH